MMSASTRLRNKDNACASGICSAAVKKLNLVLLAAGPFLIFVFITKILILMIYEKYEICRTVYLVNLLPFTFF
jgi:hypothetical protein